MDLVSTYYPYVLYAIPYVVAAYVLIREALRRRRVRREEQSAEPADEALNQPDRHALERDAMLAGVR